MSSSPRSSDLLGAVIGSEEDPGWLRADDEIQQRLGDSGAILPVAIAKESDATPRLSVGVSTTSTDRNNKLEEKAFEVRVIVDATSHWIESEDGSILELTRLKNRVEDILTENRGGWSAEGVIDDDEIQPNDDLNRYLGVVSFGYERIDRHPKHAE